MISCASKQVGIKMEISFLQISVLIVLLAIARVGWKTMDWLWLRPKRLERCLRQQGFQGNPYKFFHGDTKEIMKLEEEAKSKPMNLTDDIVPRVSPFLIQTVKDYGKNSFVWHGPVPRINIMDPEHIKEVLNKVYDFQKPESIPLIKLLATGVAVYDGEKWAKHRKIINPAFNIEKLKLMLPTFYESCNDMISKLDEAVSKDGSCELDVWPFLQNFTSDVISRTAFGSSYVEGRRIFELLREQATLASKVARLVYIPGWRFLPTSTNKRMKEIYEDIGTSLTSIIGKREKAMKSGKAPNDDLLGILLESNHKQIKDHGNNKNEGMSIDEVIEECKLFYFAGQETTSILLLWTLVALGRHPYWQEQARREVMQVFGNKMPDFDGLSHLKVVTMILNEVLRLYPPGVLLTRAVRKETKLGRFTLPAGVNICIPAILVHHDSELWGNDANEFKPERFADGVLTATKGQVLFFPFGWGPRICIGLNFAMLEAKLALTLILQHFSFQLSPSYAHAPYLGLILQPQFGAHIVLHKL